MASTLKIRNRRKKVGSVSAAALLNNSGHAKQLEELRRVRFPSPSGKVGRPRNDQQMFGI